MGFFSRIFGGRGWGELPIKFVDAIKSRLSEHHFKVLESLTSKHDILNSKFFQDPQFLVSAPDVAIKALSYLLVRLANQLAQRDLLIDAENACLLSLKLNPNNDNPAHFSLAFIYTIENRLEEAKQEANLSLQLLQDLDAKAKELQNASPDRGEYQPNLYHNWIELHIILGDRLREILLFDTLLGQPNEISKLFEAANVTIIILAVSDHDLMKHLKSFT